MAHQSPQQKRIKVSIQHLSTSSIRTKTAIRTAAFVGAEQTVAGSATPARRASAHPCSPVADPVVAALGLDHVSLPLVDGHRANLGPHLTCAPGAIGRDVAGLHRHSFERSAEPVETLAPVHGDVQTLRERKL